MERSGAQILSDIDQRAAKTRAHIQDVSENISALNKASESLQQDGAGLYIQLAKLRLGLFEDASTRDEITAAEQDVAHIFKQRQNARDVLSQKLHENQMKQQELETQRAEALSAFDLFAEELQKREDETLEGLSKQNAYRELENQIDHLEMQLMRVSHKIVAANDDYTTKIIPYQKDTLFMYLWERGYGTSKYRAGAITRFLDRKVSDIVEYEAARRNYALLSAIPEKLNAHKENLETRIEALEAQQEDLEQSAFQTNGVAQLQKEAIQKKQTLEAMDQRLNALELDHEDILDQESMFTRREDIFYANAVDILDGIYKDGSLEDLRAAALLSATPEDDSIVRKLFDVDHKMRENASRMDAYNQTLKAAQRELSEIQKARTNFKNNGYDSPRTTFKDGNMFSILLGQFVTGILTNAHFWSAVAQLCVQIMGGANRSGGGYRYSSRGGRSYSGSSRSRGSRTKRISMPRRSSGGFRTGGSF